MKITIETSNPNDLETLIEAFKKLDLHEVNIVVSKIEEEVNNTESILSKLSKKRPLKLDLEAIKKERKYQGINRDKFNQLVKDINITEPIEILLSQLSK